MLNSMETHLQHSHTLKAAAALGVLAVLSGCGGGGGETVVATTNLTGEVVKGPVSGADVCAYRVSATGKGEQLKCATTGAGGRYSMDIQYEGDVVIEASGGSYTDEATGTTKGLSHALQVVTTSRGGAATAIVTPLTAIAYNMARTMPGGPSSANFGSAAATVTTQFQLGSGVDIAKTAPTVGAGANSYGKALQGVSQFVANGGSLPAFLEWSGPEGLQQAYSTAYNAINNASTSFSFTKPSSSGTTTGTTAAR